MAVDMFLKVGDLKGEARDKELKEWIDILAFSWGGSNSGTMHTGGGGGAGKANVQDMSATKYIDISSPKLQLACLNGKHFPTAELKVRKAGEKPLVYMHYKLTDVLITSFSTGGSGSEDRLTENISINFAKVEFKYVQQSKTGGSDPDASYTYNIEENDGE